MASGQWSVVSGQSDLGLRVDLCLVLDQYPCNGNVVFLRCEVHRSQAVLSSTVANGSTVQQQCNHVSVTFL